MPQDVLGEIKSLLDISSRVDERVKNIQQSQQELNTRVNQFLGEFAQLSSRVLVIESRNGGKLHEIEDTLNKMQDNLVTFNLKLEKIDIAGTAFENKNNTAGKEVQEEQTEALEVLKEKVAKLEMHNESWQNKVKYWGALVIQGVWVIIVCYILYKFGLNTPPIP